MTQRRQLLINIASELIKLIPDRIARIAIDGVDGSGKTTFADELAETIGSRRPVIRASVDGFHNPRALRYARGRHSHEGFFEDSYNYSALKQVLLDPLSPGGSLRYRKVIFDHGKDQSVSSPEELAGPTSI